MDSKYLSGTPEIARFDFSRVNNAGVDKTQKRIDLSAEYLWNIGYGDHGTSEVPIIFSNLTKKQKLDIVAQHLERVINDAAKTIQCAKAQDAAKEAAAIDFDTNQ